MRQKNPAEVLSIAAAAFEACPESTMFFGNTFSGKYFANGGVTVHLPRRVMGTVVVPDRGLSRDEMLEFVREAQRQDRAFSQRVATAFSFLPPLIDARGVVRPGLFVHGDVGPESLESLLRSALEAIDPGASGVAGVKALSDALDRAAPAGLFFGQPAGSPEFHGFWPSAWASVAPSAADVEAIGRCVLIAQGGEPEEPSVSLVSPEMGRA